MKRRIAVSMVIILLITSIFGPFPVSVSQAASTSDEITFRVAGTELVIEGRGVVTSYAAAQIIEGLGDALSTVKSLKIGYGITTIDDSLVSQLPVLDRVEVPETMGYIEGGIECKEFIADGSFYFDGFASSNYLERVEVHGTAYFRDYGLSNSPLLQEVVLSRACGITEGTFRECKNLRTVKVSEFQGVVEKIAFQDCTNLRSVYLCGNRYAELETTAFSGCSKLEILVLPGNLKRIESGAVSDSPKLKQVQIPESVSYIGENNFSSSDIFWEGNLPETEEDFFEELQGTMYLPEGDESWNAKKESFPEITWKEWNPKEYTINNIECIEAKPTVLPDDLFPYKIPVEESEDSIYCNISDARITNIRDESEYAPNAETPNMETAQDEQGEEYTNFRFKKLYRREVFRLPQNLNIGDYQSITIKADTSAQFVVDILNDDFHSYNIDQGYYTTTRYQYEYFVACSLYPFYNGSYQNRDQTDETPGIEEDTQIFEMKLSGKLVHKVDCMAYLSIGLANHIPDEDTLTRPLHYYVYTITLNPKDDTHKKW